MSTAVVHVRHVVARGVLTQVRLIGATVPVATTISALGSSLVTHVKLRLAHGHRCRGSSGRWIRRVCSMVESLRLVDGWNRPTRGPRAGRPKVQREAPGVSGGECWRGAGSIRRN